MTSGTPTVAPANHWIAAYERDCEAASAAAWAEFARRLRRACITNAVSAWCGASAAFFAWREITAADDEARTHASALCASAARWLARQRGTLSMLPSTFRAWSGAITACALYPPWSNAEAEQIARDALAWRGRRIDTVLHSLGLPMHVRHYILTLSRTPYTVLDDLRRVGLIYTVAALPPPPPPPPPDSDVALIHSAAAHS